MILFCNKKVDTPSNNLLLNINNFNPHFWTNEKKEAFELYSELIHNTIFSENKCKTKLKFSKWKNNLNKLMYKYPYFEENLWGILLFFKYCSHEFPEDFVFVYKVFLQFMKYFYRGPYLTFVIKSMTLYLLKIKTDSIDYIDFCNYVLFYYKFCEIENKDQLESTLIKRRDMSSLDSIENALQSKQVILAIRKCWEIYNENNNLQIKTLCIKKMISIFKNIKIPQLVQKYQEILNEINNNN